MGVVDEDWHDPAKTSSELDERKARARALFVYARMLQEPARR